MQRRCRAGFDNNGACTDPGHRTGWHYPEQAERCEMIGFFYDQCRREYGHHLDDSLPYHRWCLPDCGSAVTTANDGSIIIDSTQAWIDIYEVVLSSGEKLEWSCEETVMSRASR